MLCSRSSPSERERGERDRGERRESPKLRPFRAPSSCHFLLRVGDGSCSKKEVLPSLRPSISLSSERRGRVVKAKARRETFLHFSRSLRPICLWERWFLDSPACIVCSFLLSLSLSFSSVLSSLSQSLLTNRLNYASSLPLLRFSAFTSLSPRRRPNVWK